MNRKRTKKFYLPGQGFEPQIFSNFPAHDLISCKVRVTISNKNKFPKEIGLYLETTNVIRFGGLLPGQPVLRLQIQLDPNSHNGRETPKIPDLVKTYANYDLILSKNIYLETTNVIRIGGLCQLCRASRYFGFRSNWTGSTKINVEHSLQ